MQPRRSVARSVAVLLAGAAASPIANQLPAQASPAAPIGWVRTTEGADIEGTLRADFLTFDVAGAKRQVAVQDLLSFHSAAPASAYEAACIERDLPALARTDAKGTDVDVALAELTDIGLPVLTPLLQSCVDTDAHEPDRRSRLFSRIVPGHADGRDRTLDLVRLAGGDVFRGKWAHVDLRLQDADGKETTIPAASVRRLAIRRPRVDRGFELHALRDCTYVAFFDTGVSVTEASRLQADAAGYVRLSFDEDGWATDPDGLHETLPGKRKLQEGFRWGAVLGRVGPTGARWFAGKHADKDDLGQGRLYFAVNDNEHWQNNVGSFRVRLSVTQAYDLGDAR